MSEFDRVKEEIKAIEERWKKHAVKLGEIEQNSFVKGFESEYYSMKRQDVHDVHCLIDRLRLFIDKESLYLQHIKDLKQTIESLKNNFKSLDKRED